MGLLARPGVVLDQTHLRLPARAGAGTQPDHDVAAGALAPPAGGTLPHTTQVEFSPSRRTFHTRLRSTGLCLSPLSPKAWRGGESQTGSSADILQTPRGLRSSLAQEGFRQGAQFYSSV